MNRLIRSFGAAFSGIRAAVSGQRNLKIHVGAALVVCAVGVYVDLNSGEWALVAFAIGLVISAELVNSAIEALVDMVEPEMNPRAGRVKDIAAGAVLVAALTAIIIGVLVFARYLV